MLSRNSIRNVESTNMNSELLIDAVLAMAISDHDGSVQLLLPVLRQQTRVSGSEVWKTLRPVHFECIDF
jgi:hypothetical protein